MPAFTRGCRQPTEARRASDDGQALIIVLGIAVMILAIAAVALQYTITNLSDTGSFANTVQSRLAAETGINVALAEISATGTLGSLPCSVGPGTLSSGASGYSAAITYTMTPYSGCPSAWPAGTTWPSAGTTLSAQVTSTGTMTHGANVKMVENLTVTPPATVRTPGNAFNDAVYSAGNLTLGQSQQVTAPTCAPSDPTCGAIVTDGAITCNQNTSVATTLFSYSSTDVTIKTPCSFGGGLYATAGVTLQGVTDPGVLKAFGADGITLTSKATVQGGAVARNGSISISNNSSISQGAQALGTISPTSKVSGTSCAASSPPFPVCTNLASQVMPPNPGFPVLTDSSGDPITSAAYWSTTEYTNYIAIAPANCTPYFASPALGKPTGTDLDSDVTAATTPTVINASACPPGTPLPSSPNLTLATDIALVLPNFQTSNLTTFSSSSSSTHALSIMVPFTAAQCPAANGCINLGNHTTFNSTLDVLIYTDGSFITGQNDTMTGQVLADDIVTGNNNFNLTFSPNAALTITGAYTTSYTGNATSVEVRRYVSR